MTKNGLAVDGEGWFVLNARESRWKDEGPLGSYCTFEGKRRFPHFGFNISVLQSGERMGMYHRENAQEAFLVLEGECTLIVEGKEQPLTEWDFFYCAPGTEHIILASGEQSAVVLAVGGRGRGVGGGIVYKVCKAAARYGASVVRETTDPAVAYAKVWAKLPDPGSSSTGAAGSTRTDRRRREHTLARATAAQSVSSARADHPAQCPRNLRLKSSAQLGATVKLASGL